MESKNLENDLIEYNNKKYPYLFWEATRVMNKAWSTGYTVSKENIISFLEHKLTEINLNFKEKTDFITYWAPRMMQFDSYDIHFTFNEEYKTEVADIKVTPKPESEFRVFMQYRKHTSTILKEQKIEKAIRTNSMYLEWGGSNDLEK